MKHFLHTIQVPERVQLNTLQGEVRPLMNAYSNIDASFDKGRSVFRL